MISFDALEKLHASALEPIGPDRPENLRSFGRDISVEELVSEFPHRQLWSAHGVPQEHFTLNCAGRSYELMCAATQSLELGASFVGTGRLVEPNLTANQDLICADHEKPIVALRDLPCLSLGESERTAGRLTAFRPVSLLDRPLIYSRRLDPSVEPGALKEAGSRHARRGEDQPISHLRRVAAPAIS